MLLLRYVVALALTLTVEMPLYAALLTRAWRVPGRRAISAAVGVNLATHPLLWWSLHPVAGQPSFPWIMLAAEAVVCLTEWLLLQAWLRRRWDPLLLTLSIATNAASALVGLLTLGLIDFAG